MDHARRNIFLFRKNNWLLIAAGFLFTLIAPLSVLAASSTSTTSPAGKASWYDYRPGLFAASTIYPIGQKVRVYNATGDKSVDVTINDYGPDPKTHPDRVIDLQKEAFAKLATLGAGVISVRLEPLSATSTPTVTTAPATSSIPKKTQPKRDLAKEKIALRWFTDEYGHLPKTKADWSILNQRAYSANADKTKEDFQSLVVNSKDAVSAIILDAKDNKVLWQKNAQQVLPIASLTKMVAIKTFLDTKPDLNKVVSYSQQDEKELGKYCAPGEAAMIKLKDKDQIKLRDLVYSALIGSANNAIESLVRLSSLSRPEFIKRMNANAKKWSAVNTKFVEPTGLSTSNVSTAKDYALILKNVSQDANIKKISTTAVYKFTTINTKQLHTIKNTNKLLLEGQFPLQSSKTGYLVEAGHCLAMAAQDNVTKQKFIVVTLGSPTWAKSYQTASQMLTTALN